MWLVPNSMERWWCRWLFMARKQLLLMWLPSTKHATWLWNYFPTKAQPWQHQSDSRRLWTMSGLRARNFAFSADENDPFSLTHLGDIINLPPMNSTYRSMSGWASFYHHPTQFLGDPCVPMTTILYCTNPQTVGTQNPNSNSGCWMVINC